MSDAVGAPQEAKPVEREPVAIRVPAFDVGWPKIAVLAGAIILSVGGGFWTLSSTIYHDLEEKLSRNEARNDALDTLTGVLRESVAKQGAQLDDLTRTVAALTVQLKESNADLTRQIKESNADLTRQIKEINADLSRQMGTLAQQVAQSNAALSAQIAVLGASSADVKVRLGGIDDFLRGSGRSGVDEKRR